MMVTAHAQIAAPLIRSLPIPYSQSSAGMAWGVGHIKPRRRYLPEWVKLRLACNFVGSSADIVEVAQGSVLISTHHILSQGIPNAYTLVLLGHADPRIAR